MKKTGTEFKKPYGREIFGKEQVVHYPYPRERIIPEPIFPYLVFDGGASNFANDRFGTVNSDELLRLTMSGELFSEFSSGGEFNWERSFAYTDKTDFTKKYEWQIWPQRLYMTIPVAHAFLRTGDKKYSDEWLRIIRGWDAAHPYQPFDPAIPYLQTDMTWRDMQVAWRTMSMLHGVFMLQDAPYTREDWEYIYRFIHLHTDHLYEEALDRLSKNHAQNHVLQIGVVLIMAGVMFPEFDNSEELIRIGIDTVKMNMEGSIFEDGGSNEDSPSYSHFIVRLYLETLLLLERNGRQAYPGLRESIVKQYEWIFHMSSPTGRTLPLSDSYSMDTLADLRRAEALIPLSFSRERGSRLFPNSKTGVMKVGNMTLYLDAMSFIPHGHQHAGRPEILLFRGDEAVLVEGGICSYDRWELYMRVRESRMHNVVFCPDLDSEELEIDSDITLFDPHSGRVDFVSRVRMGEVSYKWERSLTLEENRLTIVDKAKSDTPIRWQSNLHLKRNDTKVKNRNTVCQLTDNYLMTLECDREIETDLVPVMNDKNKIDYAVLARVTGSGDGYGATTVITFEDR